MSLFADVLKRVPKGPSVALAESAHSAVRVPTQAGAFIEPPLRISGANGDVLDAPFVIFSAPGAVGKSALAAHIGVAKGAAVWDLSKLTLGDNSFVGTLAQSYGPSQLAVVLDEIGRGDALFIFDAFDEAELLSGWNRVEAFIREAWQYACKSRPCFILLARSDTATLLSLLLEELGGSRACALIEIDYFERDSALAFVKASVAKSQAETKGKAVLPQAFDELFDEMIVHLAETLGIESNDSWSNRVVRSFFGYAPVLQTLASFFGSITNYKKALEEVSKRVDIAQSTDFVGLITEQLLEREQAKVVESLKQKTPPDAARWNDWSVIYSPTEQVMRIAQHVLRLAEATTIDNTAGFPTWLVDEYSGALKAFLPQHPFVRESQFSGPAFRDYIVAKLLTDDKHTALGELLLDRLAFVPTPLFSGFYVGRDRRPGKGRHAGLLYESAIARDGLQDKSVVAIWSERDKHGKIVHRMEVLGGDTGPQLLDMELTDGESDPITFELRLRNAFIFVDGALNLGVQGKDLELSDVEIECSSLHFHATRLFVRSVLNKQVSIRAGAFSTTSHDTRIHVKDGTAFRIFWPSGKAHPWVQHYDEQAGGGESLDYSTVLQGIRRILTWFQRDKRKGLARHQDLINNAAVGENKLRKFALVWLMERKIITLSEPLYFLDADLAGKAGINWTDVRNLKLTPALEALCKEFVDWVRKKAA